MCDPPSEPDLTSTEGRLGTRWLRRGARVVLRYRDDSGQATDALGELVSYDDEAAVVRTRHGDVRIPRVAIVTGKEVPPAPTRPGRAHRVVSPLDLQELMTGGMPSLRSQWLGRWLLQSADGYTGRANSVLPLGDPGLDLPGAVRQVERWYADQGLPPMAQVFGATLAEAYADGLGRHLLDAGWQPMTRVLTMTASAEAVLAAVGEPPDVALASAVDDRWVVGATQRERDNAAILTAMLDRVRDARYVTLGTDHMPDAVGRLALHPGWAGIFSVHVQPDRRRRGLARAVVAALTEGAASAGARSIYLQVEASNEPAVGLYRALGFEVHHEYVRLRPL